MMRATVPAPRRVLLVITMLASLAVPHPAPGAVGTPAKATTVITGSGNVGTTIVVPQGVTLEWEDFDVEMDDGLYAFVGLAQRDCANPRSLCMTQQAMLTPEFLPAPFISVQPDGSMDAGVYDVYVLTDGTATATLRLDGAPDGVTRITARGKVDAIVEELTPTCPEQLGSCDRLGYGGTTHTVRSPASVMVVSYDYLSPGEIPGHEDIAPGTSSSGGCLYPRLGQEGGAADDSRRLGCSMLPDEGNDWLEQSTQLAAWSVPGNGGGHMQGLVNFLADGPVYAGFHGQEHGVFGGGFRAFGFWLNGGIDAS